MHTLGTANWRIPAILDRLLPHLDLEDSTEPAEGSGRNAPEGTGELRPAAQA